MKWRRDKYGIVSQDGRWRILTTHYLKYYGYPRRELRDRGRTVYVGYAQLFRLKEMAEHSLAVEGGAQ